MYSTCNGHPREDPCEEKRACRTSRQGSSCVSGSWQAEQEMIPLRHPRVEVGEEVSVGVHVGPMEFQLYQAV